MHEEARWQRLAESKKRDEAEESQQAERTQKERATFLENAGKVWILDALGRLTSSRIMASVGVTSLAYT